MLDIENSFLVLGGWGLYNQNYGLEQILDSGMVLCYAAKWLGSKEYVFARHDEDADSFLPIIHSLLDEADAVITFNGRRHDIPMLNREFIKAGMPPPSPYTHIDLLETAKRQFKFPSNKLDWLLEELDLGKKMKHDGFPLWKRIMLGDESAWKIMKRYNIRDVRQTELLYRKLLPWIVNHPNLSLYTDEERPVCPRCGSRHVNFRGYSYTKTQKYRRFVCRKCKTWSRERTTALSTEKRKATLTT